MRRWLAHDVSMKRTVWLLLPLMIITTGCSTASSMAGAESTVSTASTPAPAASAGSVLTAPIEDAMEFAELLGGIAESSGDVEDVGMGDEPGDFGVRDAWIAAGWPADGFGSPSPTSIDVHAMRGADTVDVPFIAYAVRDTQDRCALGAVTYSPARAATDEPSLVSVVVPGLEYRDCTSQVAAQEFGAIVGTMHGDQP